MKKKLAEMIIRFRILLLVLILTLAAASVFMISKTTINYDLTRYLSEDTMTRRALAVMEQEFGSSEQLRIMFVDQDEGFLEKAVRDLNALPEIFLAAYDAEENRKETNGKMYQLVTLTLDDCDAAVLVKSLREMFPEAGEYYVGGSAAMQLDVQNSVGREIPEVMVIAVIVVLAVLLLTSHAWLEPFLILFVLAVSIIINMGTNFIFKDVSFITFAVSAILQLALSIDYAIMLLHTYNGLRAGGADGRSAMTEALKQCFMRISSSALTTIAGLLSLLFMSFTIGFDIGMVLSKGILISMLCVFLLMPSVTLLMEKPLIRTRHKPIRLGGEHLARGVYRTRKPLAAVLTIAVLLFAYLNTRITYTFTDSGATDAGESALINGVFGRSNPLVLLIPGGGSDEDYEKQRELVQRLTDLKRENEEAAVTAVSSMVTTGEAALTYYTPQEVAEMTGLNEMIVRAFFALQGFGDSVRADHLLDSAKALTQDNETVTELVGMLDTARSAFVGPHYERMLLEIPFTAYDKDFNACMEAILSTAEEFYGYRECLPGRPAAGESDHSARDPVDRGDLFPGHKTSAAAGFCDRRRDLDHHGTLRRARTADLLYFLSADSCHADGSNHRLWDSAVRSVPSDPGRRSAGRKCFGGGVETCSSHDHDVRDHPGHCRLYYRQTLLDLLYLQHRASGVPRSLCVRGTGFDASGRFADPD